MQKEIYLVNMALFMHKNIASAGEIGIWEITEPEDFFRTNLMLYPEETNQLDLIKGKKRVEWLATRLLIHHMSGRNQRMPFVKDEFGKPHLKGSSYKISISHSHDMAAAIAAPFDVGIDIQYLIAKINRIAHKFTRPEERELIKPNTELEHLHVYWGAKEALYKAYGRRKLDFCQHILIEPFEYNLALGTCIGQVKKEGYDQKFKLRYEMFGDYMLVYTERMI